MLVKAGRTIADVAGLEDTDRVPLGTAEVEDAANPGLLVLLLALPDDGEGVRTELWLGSRHSEMCELRDVRKTQDGGKGEKVGAVRTCGILVIRRMKAERRNHDGWSHLSFPSARSTPGANLLTKIVGVHGLGSPELQAATLLFTTTMTSATNGTTNGQPDAHHHANGNVDPHDLWPAPGGPIPGADGPSPLGTAGFRMNHTMVSDGD